MTRGDLAVVEEWLSAVDARDRARLMALTTPEVEVVGPRGSARADRAVLSEWLGRAGFSAEARRWFCGGDGRVVVEQDARWVDVTTGAEQDRARIASEFLVDPGRHLVTRYVRHDAGTAAALAAAGLSEDDEVTVRTRPAQPAGDVRRNSRSEPVPASSVNSPDASTRE
jgi:hypothetical protein